jgi:hypothetical protein
MTEEHVPTSFSERVYLLTGRTEGVGQVAGPLNPVVQSGDSILVFDNDAKHQLMGTVTALNEDGTATVSLG